MADFPTVTVNLDTPSAAAGLGYMIVGTGIVGTNTVAPDAVYTSFTNKTRAFNVRRGSTSTDDALFHSDTGTCQLTLDNRARTFDPLTNTDVVPNRPVQIVATWNAVDYDLFNGTVQTYALDYPAYGVDAVTTVTGADATRKLIDTVIDDLPEQLTGARVGYALDLAGWPMADRDLADGNILMPAHVGTVSAWSVVTEAADSEWGEVYVSADGVFTFRDRDAYALETRSITSQATFGDNAGELPYSDVTIGYDTNQIRNDVSVAYNEQNDIARDADATSKIVYGNRQYTLQASMSNGSDAQNYAHWLILLYKDPAVRVSSLTVKPRRASSTLWPQVLTRELGDRITVKLTPPGGGSRISRDAIIRGISHSSIPQDWTTVYTLQDVSNVPDPFIVGTSTVGSTDVVWL